MSDRSTGCPILHVDMDAFYAAVAIRDRPDLLGVPVVVGGSNRGVVLSATYAARAYGVRSAMPMARARRLCPHAVVIMPDFNEVTSVSKAVMEIFRSVTSIVQPLSIDEAFLDVSGSLRRFSSPTQIGQYLRAKVSDEQRITCSVGIAPTTQLAKLASVRAKPDGLFVVAADQVTAFLHHLDVGELWGVGDKTAAQLRRLGYRTVSDLAHTPVEVLQHDMGPGFGTRLHAMAWGQDGHTVTSRGLEEPERSIGADETFGHDLDDPTAILREVLRLSTKVASRMRKAGVSGRTITLRVRFFDFTTITRARTLRDATNVTQEIYATAVELFAALRLQRVRIRLVGVRVSNLTDTATVARQLKFGDRVPGWEDAERAVDCAAHRFGGSAVRPATLLGPLNKSSSAAQVLRAEP